MSYGEFYPGSRITDIEHPYNQSLFWIELRSSPHRGDMSVVNDNPRFAFSPCKGDMCLSITSDSSGVNGKYQSFGQQTLNPVGVASCFPELPVPAGISSTAAWPGWFGENRWISFRSSSMDHRTLFLQFAIKDNKYYIGFTSNLEERMIEHAKGLVPSTNYRRPFTLVYYEVCFDKASSIKREKYSPR